MKYQLNMKKVNFNLNETFKDKEYEKNLLNKRNNKNFYLHDGPPYANGELHLGHFVNKTLKDVVMRTKNLNGFNTPFLNGFDCHGLPVELAVEKKFGKNGNNQLFVENCYTYSNEQVSNQLEQLKKFGMNVNFKEFYKTNDHESEYEEMKAVLKFMENNYLYQNYRPVHWCKECQSSLAEAEVEYKEKTSKSLTVKFKLKNENLSVLVWTTTPYTLPANKMVAFNNRLSYGKYKDKETNEYYLKLNTDNNLDLEFVSNYVPEENMLLESPYTKESVKLHHADFVDNSGTGFVHVAPSFGLDDFGLAEQLKYKTESFVNNSGYYEKTNFNELNGLSLEDVSKKVLELLEQDNLKFKLNNVKHDYPHCWRHKTPLFTKTSREWFVDLSNVKELALEKLKEVKFYPENGRNRLSSMLKTRSNWCVSRNRLWGVPLPRNNSEEALAEYKDMMKLVKENGLSSLHEKYKNLQTLDVWFDSGMTHTTVMNKNYKTYKSDLYLEGTDQHRGWFQSSLLTSLLLNNDVPYKEVFTHGFVVDKNGEKFSKSLGNYVPLNKLLDQYGSDLLRLWCLNQDYHKDLVFSDETMKSTTEVYKKFRNTLRFMLQNLYDYNEDRFLDTESMDLLDKYVVNEVNVLKNNVLKLNEEYRFNEALNLLHVFCDKLSVLYFEANKDRLYCLAPNSTRRKLTQSVLNYVQNNLVSLLSAYLPYSTFEYKNALSNYSENNDVTEDLNDTVMVDFDKERFEKVLELRDCVNKLFEEARTKKLLSKNNEVILNLSSDLNDTEQKILSLLLGNVYVVKNDKTELIKHNLKKCNRCWNYFKELLNDELCNKCNEVEYK